MFALGNKRCSVWTLNTKKCGHRMGTLKNSIFIILILITGYTFAQDDDKVLDEYGGFVEAFWEVEKCYGVRKGYAAVYITDEQMSDAESKFNIKEDFFIKQSELLTQISNAGMMDLLKEQVRTQWENRPLNFAWTAKWSEETNKHCELMLYALTNS